MTDTSATLAPDERPTPFVSVTLQQLAFVLFTGIIVGALVWGLTRVFSLYITSPLLCGDGELCDSALRYGELAAVATASGLGLFGLVRLRVYRPLLIVLASAVTAWGVVGYAGNLFPWYGVLLTSVLAFAVCYLVYAWLTRIRSFWIVALLLAAAAVAVRLILR